MNERDPSEMQPSIDLSKSRLSVDSNSVSPPPGRNGIPNFKAKGAGADGTHSTLFRDEKRRGLDEKNEYGGLDSGPVRAGRRGGAREHNSTRSLLGEDPRYRTEEEKHLTAREPKLLKVPANGD